MIVPDTKDWTWVLNRPCPECRFDAALVDRSLIAEMVRDNAAAWDDVLQHSTVLAERSSADRWSPLEYACHVRDVFRIYQVRLRLMLDERDPPFANWDQDETAQAERYNEQDPAAVRAELHDAATALADTFATVTGDDWHRTGSRSDGASFTVESLGLYFVHDPVHHLSDVAAAPGVSLAPRSMLDHVAACEARFQAVVAGFTDEDVRRPSRLPGWTVGHVLTHIARNADSHRRRAEGAARGEAVEQYVGGYEGRSSDIEAGAGRSAPEVIADVRTAANAMLAAWDDVPPAAWLVESPDVSGTLRPLRTLPSRRWQEVEVHLVDLGVGPTHRDWSDEFVAATLPRLRRQLPSRLPDGRHAPAPGTVDERDELAWLFGRFESEDLPALPAWG